MKTSSLLLTMVTLLVANSCSQAQKPISYQLVDPCEGCEGVFEFGNKVLKSVDTLPGFNNAKVKIKVSGTIYMPDGKTPAKDVVLYIYHTDENGQYSKMGGETGWGNRHGYNRGWVKTDANGSYTFYTLKPAPYPNGRDPAHIHPIVLEPDGKYYWISDYYFEGDPFLKGMVKNAYSLRGGDNGVLQLKKSGDLWEGRRDLLLGKDIPGYNK